MLHAIVMAGGAGTRFWPLSRSHRPKQLLPIVGDEALLRQTWRRLDTMPEPTRVRIATRRDLVPQIAECLPELGEAGCIVEPEPRDTAPCVALACAHVLAEADEEARLVFVPADQWIEPVDRLQAALRLAAENAVARDRLVVLGVRPTRPETGYGYVRSEAPFGASEGFPIAAVARFVEKPDRERAASFVQDPAYLWNSGIFVWRLGTLLREFELHAPDFATGIRAMAEALQHDDRATCEAHFRSLPRISLDYALLEKTDSVDVLHVDFAWDDVGGFASLPAHLPADADGNHIRVRGPSRVTCDASHGNLVLAESDQARLIALVGCQDLVVVETADATLICPRHELDRLKTLVSELHHRELDDFR